jgi:vitamin B12 transporter
MANLGLGYRLRDGRLSINLFLHVSRDAIDGLGEALDDYETLNLTASYRVRDSLEVYGRVENLTDENYEMVPTYNTPGAAGYTGLRYSF